MAGEIHLSRTFVVFLIYVGGSLSSANSALGQRRSSSEMQGIPERTVTLGGWVQGDYGQNVSAGATVRLETTEGMMGGEQPVDTSGYFEFQGLVKAHYRMTVTAPGFQIYQQEVDLESVGEKLVINVHLSPAPRSKWLPPPASASFTDNNASKKARKEYERGSRALHDGNMPDAQSHLEKAVKEYPCYVRAQTDLALVLSEKHQSSASEAALKKAIECDPDYLDAYNELGQLYYNERKYKESEAILKEGLRRSPMSWQFYYQLGASELHLGQYRAAEQEYLKAASLSAAVPAEIHVKLADVYLKQYAYDKAYGEMQAYLHIEPHGRFAEKLKDVMRQMVSDHVLQANHPAEMAPHPPRP